MSQGHVPVTPKLVQGLGKEMLGLLTWPSQNKSTIVYTNTRLMKLSNLYSVEPVCQEVLDT